jgi:hypothetical protein
LATTSSQKEQGVGKNNPFFSPTQIKNFKKKKKNQPPVTRQLSVVKRQLGPLHGGLSSQLLTGRRKYATWK